MLIPPRPINGRLFGVTTCVMKPWNSANSAAVSKISNELIIDAKYLPVGASATTRRFFLLVSFNLHSSCEYKTMNYNIFLPNIISYYESIQIINLCS